MDSESEMDWFFPLVPCGKDSEMPLGKQIKSEIKLEQEQITETTFYGMPTEQIYHEEVGAVFESAEEIGEMSQLQLDDKQFVGQYESQISDALNDHNYTSQEIVLSQPKLGSVKDMLLSYIAPSKASFESVPTNVTNFIDNTINKMQILQFENIGKHETVHEEASPTDTIRTMLPENCSEPLEVEVNDEYFEILYKNTGENEVPLNTLLTNTTQFAKDFYNECKSLASKTEEEFKVFINDKINKLRTVANIVNRTDKCVQTLPKGSSKKRHRINHRAKRNLLDTSSDSSSDSCGDQKLELFNESNNNVDRVQCSKNDIKLNKELEYSDGIDLSKYIKLDIQNRKFRQMSCEPANDGSNSCTSGDNTDKEIDRLTNLNGLKKRHQANRRALPKDKNKLKTLIMKNTNAPNELDEDLEMSDTDNSFKESDDEVITENQYLSRFNEQIKMQLLNESNSDSGLSDQSDYNHSNKSSSTDDENKRDVVDKFLEAFKCEPEEPLKDDGINEAKEIKFEAEIKESDSLDVSDELWNDNFIQKKRSKKSLEKLMAEAEKRNQHDEIVLSSESDYSDAEPGPVEEKTRFIKPMLRMDQLANETRAAQKSESERIRRLDRKHSVLSKAIKNIGGNGNKTSNRSELILDYLEKTKTFVKVDEDIVKQLKPHQIDGVKFMYDSCYGGIDHAKKNTGSGCILAHCMGLGKTLQLIALLHTVISYKELNTAKVLVLCPKSTVMNWADELQRWLGPLKSKTNIKVFVFPDSSDISEKLRVLEEWSHSSVKRAGCLLVGYEAFRTLVFYHSYKNRGNLSSAKLESIREKVNNYLLQPGADLVVCDEGHIIKNSKSAISMAVARIITPKRIILTGTPIQNNLKEYYSMVNFIKPLYLGTEKEFANLYANPIKNGQHKDSSKKDITVMKQRSYVLHKKLSKFVQRKEAELLKTFLPQKFEYVLFIPMTAVQNTLYEYILEAIANRGDSRGKSLITDYTVLRKIWTHPKVLEDAWKNANMQKNKRDNKRVGNPHSDDDQPDDIYDSQTGSISVTNDWWRKDLSKKDLETIMPSNKLRTMFSILRMCEEKGEKCLIFSAFVAVLNVVEYFFKKITESDPEILQQIHIPTSFKVSNTWINGQDYYRLDGKTPKNIRHEMIKRFNSEANRRARVFLISAKAGGQGINLIGANRVIILDTSWNPSNDQQNIFRIFRLGQKKNCYIYRLIAMGTMEEKVYSRSVTKQAMSFRVVDEQQIDRHYNMAELAELYTLTYPKQCERTMPLLPKDTILAHLLRQSELVYKYHEHDSLLENKVEQELSEQEKTDAWDTYERELQMNLAQQEGLSAEKIQNSMLTSKLNSYLGSVPSLDMQTLLNYSLQSATLVPQYNYGLNQTYMDTLNMYQKYTAMRYPDMNSCLTDNSFASSPFGVLNAQNLNRLQSNPSLMPNLPGISNAKSQARDFGIYDTQKNRTSSMAHPQLHHPLSAELSALDNSAASSNANSVLSNLAPYKQMLENPLASLLNYSAQNYPGQAETLHANLKAGLNPFPSTLYPEKVLDAVESLNAKDKTTTKSKSSSDSNNAQKIVSSVDLTMPAQVNIPVNASPFAKNQLPLKKAHQTQPAGSVDLTTTTPVPMSLKKLPALPVNEISKNAKAANINFGSVYPSGKDFLKSNSEMQIIPTTSPPGTISITKQLNEMSPSISLTALNTTEKAKPETQKNISLTSGTENRQNTKMFNLSSGTKNVSAKAELAKKSTGSEFAGVSKLMTTPQILGKNSMSESGHKAKQTNAVQNITAKQSTHDGGNGQLPIDVNLQGEKERNFARKRASGGPRDNSNKRTKL
ncbi:transcriptional regulator ATRX-like isoform X2 [Drosophila grimshawi]|uniref:transcriptional regulator ATRX-like isoform X2 n=1 Tax=Drosophila grimshawi TaxID=7222 RepID=UPI0013EF3498|nr:transcriptional regulator ATRX-like isoform X2 [Drosophila grimshawi]